MPHVAVITEDGTFVDDRPPVATPEHVLAAGIVSFIEAVIKMLGGSGTVLVDAKSAALLGLPTGDLPETGDGSKKHPAAEALRGAGFKVREIYRWARIFRGPVRLNLGLIELIDPSHCPAIEETPAILAASLYQWRLLSGQDWYGAAADAGNDVLRGMFAPGQRRRMVKPEWWIKPPLDRKVASEVALTPGRWHRRPDTGETHGHKLDKRRAHLAALTTTQVAGGDLEYRDGQTQPFDVKRCGWWCVKLAEWPHGELMPDPAGYGPVLDDGYRWVATPTLELIEQLRRSGHHGGILDLRESYTAPGVDILKHLAKTLRDVFDGAAGIADDDVREVVQESTKAAYRQFAGFWQSTQSDVQRADWSAAMVAGNRVSVWRAAWKAIEGPDGDFQGPVPLWFDTDCVIYGGGPDPIDPPAGWSMEDKLGGWRRGSEPFELKYREQQEAGAA